MRHLYSNVLLTSKIARIWNQSQKEQEQEQQQQQQQQQQAQEQQLLHLYTAMLEVKIRPDRIKVGIITRQDYLSTVLYSSMFITPPCTVHCTVILISYN